jgi:hypothetical protein
MRFAVQAVLSIVLGFFLMGPLAMLFEAMRWAMFHSWALAHGTFVIAWPALTVVSFVALSLVPWFRRDFRDDLALGAAALVGAGILTGIMWPGDPGWMSVVFSVAIAFGSSALLCAAARRAKLVPVAMAVPLLLNDSMYLVLGGDFAWDYVKTEMIRTTIPVVIGAVMGFVVAVTVTRGLNRRLGPAQEDGS